MKRGERLGEIKNRFGRNSVSFNSGGRRGTGGGKCDFVSLNNRISCEYDKAGECILGGGGDLMLVGGCVPLWMKL